MREGKRTKRHLSEKGFAGSISFKCPVHVENVSKLSKGEICVANFIPPVNGASLGSFFCS